MKQTGGSGMIERSVTLTGITPIMFNRYPGDNKTKLTPRQKVYLADDGETLILPSLNVMSFLSAENTKSVPKILYDSRQYKAIAFACLNYVSVTPYNIPFLRDGEPIKVGEFRGDKDEKSGLWVHSCVARLEKGIPNPQERPVLPLPWSLELTVTLLDNEVVNETMLHGLFAKGGLAIGFGAFRGAFGKFKVTRWE